MQRSEFRFGISHRTKRQPAQCRKKMKRRNVKKKKQLNTLGFSGGFHGSSAAIFFGRELGKRKLGPRGFCRVRM